MKHIIQVVILAVAILTTFYSQAFAVGSSGFELGTNTARSLGRANAVSADPGEPAAVVFNPAGLTSLEGHQVSASTSLITLSTHYDSRAAGRLDEDSATLMSTVPSFFLSLSTPNKDLKLGAGVNAPFGLTTAYSSSGNFKYTSNYNQIKTVAYNLSAAYQVREWISVGLGFTYMDASTKQVGKLNNAAIFGAALPDSEFELDVEGDGYNMNMGVQIKPAEKHYLGIFYRTETRTKQTGSISIDGITPAPAILGAYNATSSSFNTSADTDVTFPGSVTIGYKYQATPKWDVEADFTWTGWSSFDRVDIAFETTSAILNSLEPVTQGFKNTFSFNLGTSYKLDDVWTVSGGYWYYAMAASKAYYSGAIPDGDRHAGSLGLVYNHKNYSIGLSYAALFITKTDIDNNIGATNGTTIDGEYSSFVNIISMDAVYKF